MIQVPFGQFTIKIYNRAQDLMNLVKLNATKHEV